MHIAAFYRMTFMSARMVGATWAIARVNRVFKNKPGGLVVDYLGVADQLKQALITYTESGGKGDPVLDTAKAIAVMLEKHSVASDTMHGFRWDKWVNGTPAQRLALIPVNDRLIFPSVIVSNSPPGGIIPRIEG